MNIVDEEGIYIVDDMCRFYTSVKYTSENRCDLYG